MGRLKHRPGRAGTWLEIKVRNGQRYLYERTRVYEGGKPHVTSKYLHKLLPADREPVEEPQASSDPVTATPPIMLGNQNRYRAPPLAAKKRAASRPHVGSERPPASVLRATSTNRNR